ncbi:hypothetical protein EMGBS9_03560, partial [Actinomycetota bacterium]
RGPLQGDVTHEWEQSIIRTLKKVGAIFDADKVAGKYTGYSESWRKDSFHAKKIIELMEFVKDLKINRNNLPLCLPQLPPNTPQKVRFS